MVTLLRGMPVELEKIYCFLLFWGVGGARKKTILYINESCRTSHTQGYQGPISLSYRNGIWAPNTGHRSKIPDCLYGRSYTLWSTTDISLRSPSWVGSWWIPGKWPHPPVQKVHSYLLGNDLTWTGSGGEGCAEGVRWPDWFGTSGRSRAMVSWSVK